MAQKTIEITKFFSRVEMLAQEQTLETVLSQLWKFRFSIILNFSIGRGHSDCGWSFRLLVRQEDSRKRAGH